MKKILLLSFVLTSWLIQAQNPVVAVKASDFKLTNDVQKYEVKEYFFDKNQGKYQITSDKTFYFDKGLVVKVICKSNYSIYEEKSTVYNYENGKIKTIVHNEFDDVATDTFVYKNNRIVEKNKTGSANARNVYDYDSKGILIKQTDYEEDALVRKIAYSNYQDPQNYYKKTINCYNETEHGTYEEWVKNGFLVREKVVSEYYQGESTYAYDKLGNIVSQISGNKNCTNNYVYDDKGNVLKSRIIQKGFGDAPDTNYFSFATITYSNGKTLGSTNFDVNFVKKYEPKSISYQVNDVLVSEKQLVDELIKELD